MRAKHALLLMIGLAALPACQKDATVPTRKDPLAERQVDQVLYGLEHVMTNKGVRKADLHADTAYFRDADTRVDMKGVRLEFFNEATGAVSGTLTSREGEYETGTGAMRARGEAVLLLQGPEGERRIESEELNYDLQADRVWSDKPTVMREGGKTVRGTSFQSDTRFQDVTVHAAKVSGVESSGGGTGVRF